MSFLEKRGLKLFQDPVIEVRSFLSFLLSLEILFLSRNFGASCILSTTFKRSEVNETFG